MNNYIVFLCMSSIYALLVYIYIYIHTHFDEHVYSFSWFCCGQITHHLTNARSWWATVNDPFLRSAFRQWVKLMGTAEVQDVNWLVVSRHPSENMTQLGWSSQANINGKMPNWWQPNHQPGQLGHQVSKADVSKHVSSLWPVWAA